MVLTASNRWQRLRTCNRSLLKHAATGFLAAWVVIALSLAQAYAGAKKRHKVYPKTFYESSAPRTQSKPNRKSHPDRYYERDSNKLPFGSQIWWDQMLREGRLGRS